MVPLWLQALLYGLLSALSLPIGAILGIVLAPVSPRSTARWMAFGSGALVFAVATELYGEMLEKISDGMREDKNCSQAACQQHVLNLVIQTGTGLLGSVLYVLLNQALARAFGAHTGGGRLSDHSSEESISEELEELDLEQLPDPLVGASFRGAVVDVKKGATNVAMSMWLGLLLDGLPEALLLGFMTNESRITYVFLGAIFIANFPEAFSGASMLVSQGMAWHRNFSLWFGVFVTTGVLSMVGSLASPVYIDEGSWEDYIRSTGTAALEGITGGAMLAMVATAMLPEAFRETGEIAGIFFVLGFVVSVLIAGMGARFGS